jgi:hypothetical protein
MPPALKKLNGCGLNKKLAAAKTPTVAVAFWRFRGSSGGAIAIVAANDSPGIPSPAQLWRKRIQQVHPKLF